MFHAKIDSSLAFASFVLLLVISAVAVLPIKSVEVPNNPSQEVKKEPKVPSGADLQDYVHGHREYKDIISTMKRWESSAPNLVEVGTYGKTTKQEDHYYFKISNEFSPAKKTVLITACIHGNEPWSTSTVMAYAGKLISSYGKDKELTDLIDSRNVYFIPVVSPDSYPGSRGVDGVDPNRNFPTLSDPDRESVAPVRNLQKLFLSVKPNAVLAGHTYGRVFLIPWGDSTKDNPNLSDYERIASKMSELANYRYQRACQMYNRPIYGTEIDWYHRNGAFAMVIEFGSHQRKPSLTDTEMEFNRTFPALLYFIRESADVSIKEIN
jgi:carboxypeptidase T